MVGVGPMSRVWQSPWWKDVSVSVSSVSVCLFLQLLNGSLEESPAEGVEEEVMYLSVHCS